MRYVIYEEPLSQRLIFHDAKNPKTQKIDAKTRKQAVYNMLNSKSLKIGKYSQDIFQSELVILTKLFCNSQFVYYEIL